MNLEDRLIDLENSLAKAVKTIGSLRGMEANLAKACSGGMPSRLVANTGSLKDVDDIMAEDDEWFIEQMAKVASTREPVAALMNLGTIIARLDDASQRMDGRISKLTKRISSTAESPERRSAIELKARLVDAKRVMESRIGIALNRFFEIRLYTINATLKLTEKVCNIWKNGSAGLRSAALKSSASQSLSSLLEWERFAAQGALKLSGTNGKGGVRI